MPGARQLVAAATAERWNREGQKGIGKKIPGPGLGGLWLMVCHGPPRTPVGPPMHTRHMEEERMDTYSGIEKNTNKWKVMENGHWWKGLHQC